MYRCCKFPGLCSHITPDDMFAQFLQVHTYNMFGQRLPRHFSLGAAVKAEGIADACISGNVLVAQTVSLPVLSISEHASGGVHAGIECENNDEAVCTDRRWWCHWLRNTLGCIIGAVSGRYCVRLVQEPAVLAAKQTEGLPGLHCV